MKSEPGETEAGDWSKRCQLKPPSASCQSPPSLFPNPPRSRASLPASPSYFLPYTIWELGLKQATRRWDRPCELHEGGIVHARNMNVELDLSGGRSWRGEGGLKFRNVPGGTCPGPPCLWMPTGSSLAPSSSKNWVMYSTTQWWKLAVMPQKLPNSLCGLHFSFRDTFAVL